MPKFIYTVLVLSFILWVYLLYTLGQSAPDSFFNIIRLLTILLLALCATLSIPLFFIVKKKHSELFDQRVLYRKSLKWSIFASFGAVFLLGLKAFKIFNVFNAALFALLYASVFTQLKSKK